MALTKGLNSYVTLDEADSYFQDRLDSSSWVNTTSEKQEQSLVTATSLLEDFSWTGVVVDNGQNLAFPRSGSFFDKSRGGYVAFSGAYSFPSVTETETSLGRDIQLLRKAVYEMAYHLLNNEGLLDKTGSVTDIKVGPIELKEVIDASTTSTTTRKLIEPMLKSGGNRYWRGGW